jgi:excisionase family DNA binding protein
MAEMTAREIGDVALRIDAVLQLLDAEVLVRELRRRGFFVSQNDKELTAEELPTLLPFSIDTIRELTQRKEIPHIRYGHRTVRYPLREISEWIEKRRQAGYQRPKFKRR